MDTDRLHAELATLLNDVAADPQRRGALAPRIYGVIADLAVAGERPSPEALRTVRHLRATDTEGHFENLPV